MSSRARGWMANGYAFGMLAGTLWGITLLARAAYVPETDEELATQRSNLLTRIEAEGFNRDNLYLKGRMIAPQPYRMACGYGYHNWPYQAEGFPYRWDFDDGSTCGITATTNLARLRVENGQLQFTVRSAETAGFEWGNFDPINPVCASGTAAMQAAIPRSPLLKSG
jgi:hypothetical protein